MTLSIFETLATHGELTTSQLKQVKKHLTKIIDKGGVTVVCTDTLITSYNCNRRKLTK